MKRTSFIAYLSFLFAVNLQAQTKISQHARHRIDSLFQHVNARTPGYMVALIKDDTYLFEKGYGAANLEYGIPITAGSAFNIASLSKQFTAACIALLVLEGKVSLDDNVRKYIPGLPGYDHEVKIKHLVYMTSGISEYYSHPRKNHTDWSGLNFFSVDTAIASSLSTKNLEFRPGTKWWYSNVNYMLLAKVVEKVSGMRFSEFAKVRLFDPLQMRNTFVNDDIFQVIPNRVNGYNHRDAENTAGLIRDGYLADKGEGFLQIGRNSPHYGGSGMYTSMDDLKKWIANFDTKKIGGQAFYDLMHKTVEFEHDKKNDAFGLVLGTFKGGYGLV